MGVRWSKNFDAYARGEIGAREIECVLCQSAPCQCTQCPKCGMTEQARFGGCPRGCGKDE